MAPREQTPGKLAKRFRMKLCLPFLTGAAAGFTVAALPNLNPTAEQVFEHAAVEGPPPGEDAAAHGTAERTAVSKEESARSPLPTSATEARERLTRWLAQGAPEEQLELVHQWLDGWSTTDPRAALAFAAGAPRFPHRNRAFAIPLAHLCRANAAETISWIQHHLTLDERQEVAEAILERIATEAPEATLELAFAADVPVDPGYFAVPIGALVRTNPAAALAHFGKLSENGRRRTVTALVANWASVDFDAALRWAESNPGSVTAAGATDALLREVLTSQPDRLDEILARLQPGAASLCRLANQDTDAALRLMPHLSGDDLSMAVHRIVRDQLSQDPELALALARESLSAKAVTSTISNAWQQWLHSDRSAALSWMESVTDQPLQSTLRSIVEGNKATDDPRRALAAFDRGCMGTLSSSEAVDAALRLANYDPSAAAQWMSRHEDIVPAPALRQASERWFARDATAAAAWAASLPMGSARDTAYQTAADHWIERGNSEQATQAISFISDPACATQSRWRAFAQLSERDTAAALAWLARQPLSAEVRESWRTIVEAERLSEFVSF